MKFKLLLGWLLIFHQISGLAFEPTLPESHGAIQGQMLVNFDDLQEEAMKINALDTIVHKPPSVLLVWMRIIGSPLVNAYFKANHALKHWWHAMIQFLKIKTTYAHEHDTK